MKEYRTVCMYCGKKSNKLFCYSKFKYRVIRNDDSSDRDFCSLNCLVKYYSKVMKEQSSGELAK